MNQSKQNAEFIKGEMIEKSSESIQKLSFNLIKVYEKKTIINTDRRQ